MNWAKCKHIDTVILDRVWVFNSCPNPNKKESPWFTEDYVTTHICKECELKSQDTL